MKQIDLNVIINLLMKSFSRCNSDCNNCNQFKHKVMIKTNNENEFNLETILCDEAIKLIKEENFISIKKNNENV